MEFLKIEKDDKKGIERLSETARPIIKEYYDPIIGAEQNDYMIGKFQSVEGLTEQLEKGYEYYIVKNGDTSAGFFGFYKRGDEMYLSKFYLKKDERGKGTGKKILEFLKEVAKERRLKSITLNVNKYNGTVSIYEKLGFIKIRDEKNDIGNGFFMDDFVYEFKL